MFLLTTHPHIIGHRSRIVILEELIAHIRSMDDVTTDYWRIIGLFSGMSFSETAWNRSLQNDNVSDRSSV